MANIQKAELLSREMRRKIDGLLADYSQIGCQLWYGQMMVQVNGTIDGGSESHECMIVWPGENGDVRLNPEKEHDVHWHCDCQDFRFTFHPHIFSAGEALGDFPEYIPNGRGSPRAISDFGMCKHVLCLFDKLKSDGRVMK